MNCAIIVVFCRRFLQFCFDFLQLKLSALVDGSYESCFGIFFELSHSSSVFCTSSFLSIYVLSEILGSNTIWHGLGAESSESFQLQMGFSFPFLRAKNLRLSLLNLRGRSFLISCT